MYILRFIIAVIIAYFVGQLVSKIKLPAILGWLITGMIIGPHALAIINIGLLDAVWYEPLLHILECIVGIMIGTELVFSKLKKSGTQIVITTLTQSLGTFIVVTLAFGAIFYFMDIPLYLATIFGGIALATAPAPALSIVKEFKTDGPVTRTLIPMAALDDIVGIIVFFSVIALVSANGNAQSMPLYMTLATMILLPIIIGIVAGLAGGSVLKKASRKQTIPVIIIFVLVASFIGLYFDNFVLQNPSLNYMLIGMAFSATFSNMISEEKLAETMQGFAPILGLSMIIVILNLGAPLDYHLILGAGIFTVIYIVARAIGKYSGAYFGATWTKMPTTVKKYLGLTLLPHSGVSLVFTGIAVSTLSTFDPSSATIVQGTIAAAAVINEIIAVIISKKAFEWAGEFHKQGSPISPTSENVIITISRQYGSGGREIGLRLSQELNIPFYDKEIIEASTVSSNLSKSHFESPEDVGTNPIVQSLASEINNNTTLHDIVFDQQAAIITEYANKGSCIFVGRCADYILKDSFNTINIYIYSDMKARADRIINVYKENVSNIDELIAKTDKKRESYYKHYTGSNSGIANNYDICLDCNKLGMDECIKIIKALYLNKLK